MNDQAQPGDVYYRHTYGLGVRAYTVDSISKKGGRATLKYRCPKDKVDVYVDAISYKDHLVFHSVISKTEQSRLDQQDGTAFYRSRDELMENFHRDNQKRSEKTIAANDALIVSLQQEIEEATVRRNDLRKEIERNNGKWWEYPTLPTLTLGLVLYGSDNHTYLVMRPSWTRMEEGYFDVLCIGDPEVLLERVVQTERQYWDIKHSRLVELFASAAERDLAATLEVFPRNARRIKELQLSNETLRKRIEADDKL